MKNYLITFRSVTFAQRGERLLKELGYPVALRRTPKWMEEQGCGYSLQIKTGDIHAAAEALKARQLPVKRIYVQRENGRLEAAEL